jgi:hypothetical protein
MATLSVEDLSMDERKAQIEAIITYAVQDGSLAAMPSEKSLEVARTASK